MRGSPMRVLADERGCWWRATQPVSPRRRPSHRPDRLGYIGEARADRQPIALKQVEEAGVAVGRLAWRESTIPSSIGAKLERGATTRLITRIAAVESPREPGGCGTRRRERLLCASTHMLSACHRRVPLHCSSVRPRPVYIWPMASHAGRRTSPGVRSAMPPAMMSRTLRGPSRPTAGSSSCSRSSSICTASRARSSCPPITSTTC